VSEGRSSLPFLLRRLESGRKDFRRVAIIEVIEDIDRHHTDLTNDPHLLEVLKRVVLEIENPLHRERAEYMVNSISSEQPTNPLEQTPAR
jgi:purine nucleoside permease